MTDTPHLHALAMRTAAAARIAHNPAPMHPSPGWTPAEREAYRDGQLDAAVSWQNAILALPLEADHAALVAEAKRLPEIAAMLTVLRTVKSTWILPSPDQLALDAALQPFAALETP